MKPIKINKKRIGAIKDSVEILKKSGFIGCFKGEKDLSCNYKKKAMKNYLAVVLVFFALSGFFEGAFTALPSS